MVAFHEILNDELPVGVHIVVDGFADFQPPQIVAGEGGITAKTFDNRSVDLRSNRLRMLGKVQPDKAFPDLQGYGQQAKGEAVELGIIEYIWSADQPSIESIGPGMIAALD
jgi:hypothetical protein